MNLNEKLYNLIGPDILGLEIAQDIYEGNEKEYIVYTYEDETPLLSADNKVLHDIIYMQIQLITPKEFDYFILKTRIRNILEKNDFIVTSISSLLGTTYIGTSKTRQTIFQVEYQTERVEENE